MASITAIANDFFAACETGKGWEVCKTYCAPNATFTAQAEPLTGVKTLAEYADWMKGLMTIMPDGSYEVKSFATDTERRANSPARMGQSASRGRSIRAMVPPPATALMGSRARRTP